MGSMVSYTLDQSGRSTRTSRLYPSARVSIISISESGWTSSTVSWLDIVVQKLPGPQMKRCLSKAAG
jgi:hypothetical protein